MTDADNGRSLRRIYLEWVEARIEAYKDDMPRNELLQLADEIVEELRVSRKGQYQLTEVLLCAAMDRKIFRELKLPGYRRWRDEYMEALSSSVVATEGADSPPS